MCGIQNRHPFYWNILATKSKKMVNFLKFLEYEYDKYLDCCTQNNVHKNKIIQYHHNYTTLYNYNMPIVKTKKIMEFFNVHQTLIEYILFRLLH